MLRDISLRRFGSFGVILARGTTSEGLRSRMPIRRNEDVRDQLQASYICPQRFKWVVGGEGLYSIEEQSERIATIREVANTLGIPFFINARTDLFLKNLPADDTRELVDAAVERAIAYSAAGATGLFAPGLRDAALIKDLCNRSPLPVNIFVIPGVPSNENLAELGVARISYGPGPYRQMIDWLKSAASDVYTS